MHSTKVTLSDILSSQRQNIIPVFQRPYSWTEKNWSELWSDIESVLEDGDKNLEHFLGPMIVDKGDTGSYVPEKYLVIDGQQRLITLTVLLCAMRDLAASLGNDAFASSVSQHLNFRTTRGEVENRVVPRSTDSAAFQTVLNSRLTSREKKPRIIKAYRYYKKEIKARLPQSEQDSIDFLDDLFTVVIARLKFVSITLEQNDDPTKIYESMNFKGRTLLVADLIRNYVLMHLPHQLQEALFAAAWEPFENKFADSATGEMDAKELEDFYYRYVTIGKGYFAKRLLYSTYKQHLKGFIEVAVDDDSKMHALESLVAHQARYAEFYRRIVHPELEPDDDLSEAFKRFDYLDSRTATPFLMSLYDRYENRGHADPISKSIFLDMLSAAESFILRRSILRLRTRGYALDFAQAINQSSNPQQLHAHFDSKEWPKDDAIREALLEFPLYRRERKKARLILQQLEHSFGHKETVDLSDSDRIQIEHIMPQSKDISPAWKTMLGEDARTIHEKYVDTLGNLTLTGYNRELGAKSFPEKKSEYAKHGAGSHLELNRDVLRKIRWTEFEITGRSRELADRFIAIWTRPEMPD